MHSAVTSADWRYVHWAELGVIHIIYLVLKVMKESQNTHRNKFSWREHFLTKFKPKRTKYGSILRQVDYPSMSKNIKHVLGERVSKDLVFIAFPPLQGSSGFPNYFIKFKRKEDFW